MNESNLLEEDYYSNEVSIIGKISRAEVEVIINENIETLFEILDKIKFLQKVALFNHISSDLLESISRNMTKKKLKKNSYIFMDRDLSDKIYIVKSGSIEILKDSKVLRVIGKYETFGERGLVDRVRTASARTVEDSEIYEIDSHALLDIAQLSLFQLELDRRKYYQNELDIRKLYLKTELPNIGYRKRYIVKHVPDGLLYTVTVIPKSSLKTTKDCYALVEEKKIMIQLEHNLLIKLVSSINDDSKIWFITEYIQSKSLRELLPLSEGHAKNLVFFLCNILEYLHDKNIAYRGLCTDNIAIGKLAHPYLFDFKSSKVVPNRTYTKIGNPFYQSPEMILGRGYTKSTDY